MFKSISDDLWERPAFWFWARVVFVVTCLLVGGALASGCARPSSAHVREASALELRSVVTLVTQSAVWREPSLSEGFSNAGRLVLAYEPYCSAFAVERAGRERLVTAAHCMARAQLANGAEARYREPSGWGLGRATVVYVNEERDYAELTLTEGHGLVPLEIGRAPLAGAYVTSPSSFFGEATAGRVESAAVAPGGRFAFGGRIGHGRSGAPVLDAAGRAVGVVVQCLTEADGSYQEGARPCADGVIAGVL